MLKNIYFLFFFYFKMCPVAIKTLTLYNFGFRLVTDIIGNIRKNYMDYIAKKTNFKVIFTLNILDRPAPPPPMGDFNHYNFLKG